MGHPVTIAGGGIAGICAALRLAERGCTVTLYEMKGSLGGNLGSRTSKGYIQDIYPHMFQEWYSNFWQLLVDGGVITGTGAEEKNERFSAFHAVDQLRKGAYPRFDTLEYPYSTQYLLQNVFSGVADPGDSFLFGFSGIDLQAELMSPTVRLQNMSLTGYLNTCLYLTDPAVEAWETFISRVWGVPGYLISAGDCLTYSSYCYYDALADAWLTRKPASEAFVVPLEHALRERGVTIVPHEQVVKVTCASGRVRSIHVEGVSERGKGNWVGLGNPREEPVEDLVLAVPPAVLRDLVRRGEPGERVVDSIPRLAELARVSSQNVPIMTVYFKHQLQGMSPYPVGLLGSKLNLAFTDISQIWSLPEQQGTVLAVSCSEPNALLGPPEPDDRAAVLEELAEYLGLPSGTGVEGSDAIDWLHTDYHDNSDAQITINTIGTAEFRPQAYECEIHNLFFAGDGCQHDFGITTAEAATATGVAAAAALVEQRKLGTPPEVVLPPTLPKEVFVAMRIAGLPLAYAIRAAKLLTPNRSGQEQSMLEYLLTPGLGPRRGPSQP
jgi:NAD(P)-binding Rossmann-like domain/Flavin containing amine oxidoreductase